MSTDHEWTTEDRKAALACALTMRDVAFRNAIDPSAFASQALSAVREMQGEPKSGASAAMRALIDQWESAAR